MKNRGNSTNEPWRTVADHGGSRNRGGGPRGSRCGSPRNRTVRWLGGSRFAKTGTEPWRFGAVRANRRGLWNRGQHYWPHSILRSRPSLTPVSSSLPEGSSLSIILVCVLSLAQPPSSLEHQPSPAPPPTILWPRSHFARTFAISFRQDNHFQTHWDICYFIVLGV